LHLFGDLRERQRIRPVDLKRAVDRGNRTSAVEIGAECAELELAVIEDRVGASACGLCHRRLLPFWVVAGSTTKIAKNTKSLAAVARNSIVTHGHALFGPRSLLGDRRPAGFAASRQCAYCGLGDRQRRTL